MADGSWPMNARFAKAGTSATPRSLASEAPNDLPVVPCEEWLWMNFPIPTQLHDYRYVGAGSREREKFRRQQRRWSIELAKMNPLLARRRLMSVLNVFLALHACGFAIEFEMELKNPWDAPPKATRRCGNLRPARDRRPARLQPARVASDHLHAPEEDRPPRPPGARENLVADPGRESWQPRATTTSEPPSEGMAARRQGRC